MAEAEEIWVEKYRPRKLDEIVGQEEVVERLKRFVEKRSLPHLMFAGPAGTGKTTAALCIARELFGEGWRQNILELNASDERKIETVRTKVKDYAKTRPIGEVPYKIILLDEADNMCLPTGTKIIVGKVSTGWLLEKNIEEIGGARKRWISIPSVDLKTSEVQDDEGKLVDSGYADFYAITLEDGRRITASQEHPFFTLVEGELRRTQLRYLNVGDRIVDYRDKIMEKCEICGKWTLNKRFCSTECQHEGHALEMLGYGNPMYGGHHGVETRKLISRRLRESNAFAGDRNPSKRPEVRAKKSIASKRLWEDPTYRKKLLPKLKKYWDNIRGKSDAEIMGSEERAEWKRRMASSTYRGHGIFLDSNYRRHLPKIGHVRCEVCGRSANIGGRDGIYVHHIERNKLNNRRENLMFVCPACHNRIHDVAHRSWTHGRKKAWSRWLKERYARVPPEDRKTGFKAIPTDGGTSIDTVSIIKIEPIGRMKAWNLTVKKNKCFILGNGILTHNTHDAQQALRRMMEMYSRTTRFCLDCNYSSRIIEPIQSRCAVFRFRRLSEKEVSHMLERIARWEKLTLTEDAIKVIIYVSEGDMRRAINMLQAATALGKKVTEKMIYEVSATAHPEEVRKMLELAIAGKFEEARNKLYDLLIGQGLAGEDVLEQVHREIFNLDLPERTKVELIDKTGEFDFRLVEGANERIQLEAMLAHFSLVGGRSRSSSSEG